VLGTELPALVARAEAKEATTRRTTVTRLEEGFKDVGSRFAAAIHAATAAERRVPTPPGRAAAGGGRAAATGATAPAVAGGGGGPAGGGDIEIMARLHEADLTEALISERNEQIEALTGAALEVREAFADIAHLVATQGEGLAMIDKNTSDAKDNTDAGVKHLQAAKKLQGRYRCCLLIFLAIIILIGGALTAYFLISK